MGLAKALKAMLDDHGIDHLVSVANSESAPLYFACREDPSFVVIDACREGEGVGLCCGLILGGVKPILSMENLGLFESLDTLRALPLDYGLPLPLLIGYTGRPSPGFEDRLFARHAENSHQVVTAGNWTEPVLDLAGIDAVILNDEDDLPRTAALLKDMEKQPRPIAILVERT